MLKNYDSSCCFRSREESTMRRVCWEITTGCNLNCKFCHRYGFDNKYYDVANLSETIKLLKERHIENIIISGGEPLLQPDIFDIINILFRENFELDICSNGTLITYDIAMKLKQYLSEISISIDGYDSLRHDHMRNSPGCFNKTINGVLTLIKLGFEVHVTTVVDVTFIEQIVKMTDFLVNLGVRSVSYLGLIPINTGQNPLFNSNVQDILLEQLTVSRNKHKNISINSKQLLASANCKCGAGDIVWGLGVDGLQLYDCLLTRKRDGKTVDDISQGRCPGSFYLTRKLN